MGRNCGSRAFRANTTLSAPPVAAVLIHVADVGKALDWYARAFPTAVRTIAPGTDFVFLQVGPVRLELVPADEKVGSGAAGTVVYWQVEKLEQALRHFCSLGATLYRGPMLIEAGQGMCQVRDPWGNCIGLRGPDPPRETT
ncbi:VOC family protein [Piscinibacter sakaiensis]|uniref:VOC family protein n=1 Tax=Piscinibacter sakaiensis TaxID=1547922 RepID=UPI003AADF22D